MQCLREHKSMLLPIEISSAAIMSRGHQIIIIKPLSDSHIMVFSLQMERKM